ncbi:MAG: TatD family hydrolase [Gammaproteobacteria bacterium]|nr:TatD family hydrolase [Gammaproteobacteria bacterium]
MELFDSHCHLDIADFDLDRDEVLVRARDAGVSSMVIPGIDAIRWDTLLTLCQSEEGLYPALGLHPMFYKKHTVDEDIRQLERYLSEKSPVAIGEIGLDFYDVQGGTNAAGAGRRRSGPGRGAKGESIQYEIFEKQLSIARDAALPVILHVRKAHDEVLQRLKKYKVVGGTAHAFNGSVELAQRYIDLGFKLGFGGMVTYEKSTKLRELVKMLPLESIVLETDAPDMSPTAHHGERNSPEYLPEIAQVISEMRDISVDEVARATTNNAKAVFQL